MMDRATLLASVQDGEDSELDLKEVGFRGRRVAVGGKERRAASEMAEVLASMARRSIYAGTRPVRLGAVRSTDSPS